MKDIGEEISKFCFWIRFAFFTRKSQRKSQQQNDPPVAGHKHYWYV
jgi:hypothetical protein